ncbi:NO-inducible flavohemoprotein [Psychromonas sp. 14N.309.X.WAT.B.A12]|uniref:NO-inducible flavohemoprotein n=1 Tax=Psychromonas sp. 14N.309.X.WAT.B.A12 TaxID=2998322 RepID=UPI0025B00D1B|nr:NO-inducible flavohemoprotein [Psychromonas sp. 14N.309.X.WAT.B.A12]MDN2663737.1 NO-inducible flavohemoprotein [Psychromonas sp. 14N.309.X.WAT.B.A12]
MLTDNEIAIIKASTPALAEYGEQITGRFYQILLAKNPELKNIFNMTNQQSGNQKHALAMAVYAFSKYVDNLSVILGDVERIAQKHASLGIKAEHYPLVGSALLEAIEEVLNPGEEVIAAWASGYGVLANVFIEREKALYKENADKTGGWSGTRDFIIVKMQQETPLITSFYLQPSDQGPIAEYMAGQYISIHLHPQGQDYQQIRQYSLSGAFDEKGYRISVKKELNAQGEGLVSNYLHSQFKVGDTVKVTPPCGEFVLQQTDNPAVLISGGVGITPMQAMLETLTKQTNPREVHFIHGAQDRQHHAFKNELDVLVEQQKVNAHCFYQQVDLTAQGEHHGLIDLQKIHSLLPSGVEYYICGPLIMMKAVYQQLKDLKISDDKIHYEVFGPNKSLV